MSRASADFLRTVSIFCLNASRSLRATSSSRIFFRRERFADSQLRRFCSASGILERLRAEPAPALALRVGALPLALPLAPVLGAEDGALRLEGFLTAGEAVLRRLVASPPATRAGADGVMDKKLGVAASKPGNEDKLSPAGDGTAESESMKPGAGDGADSKPRSESGPLKRLPVTAPKPSSSLESS